MNPARFTYDSVGNLQQVTDPAGIKTRYDYNGFSQVTTRTDYHGASSAAITSYSYDAAGRLSLLDPPRADVNDSVSYTYDLDGRLLTSVQNGLILPGTSSTPVTTSYTWDDAGERVRVAQPMSLTQTLTRNWTYDPVAGTSTYSDTATTTNHYSPQGWLESVDDPRGLTLKFEYDNLGRRTRRYALSGSTTKDEQSFSYDLAGNRLSAKVVSSGTTISMDYDADGRISHVYQASGTPTTTYAYNASTGRLSSVVDPAGTTSYDYNANGQLFHLTDPFNTTAKVTYGYDSAGRLTSRTDPAGLTWIRNFEASTGRLYKQTITNPKTGKTLGSFTLGFDAASNVTSRAEAVLTEKGKNNADSGTWSYHYDAAGRMDTSTAPSGTITTYGYDGASDRTLGHHHDLRLRRGLRPHLHEGGNLLGGHNHV